MWLKGHRQGGANDCSCSNLLEDFVLLLSHVVMAVQAASSASEGNAPAGGGGGVAEELVYITAFSIMLKALICHMS